MQKGFSGLLVIIAISLLIILPLSTWVVIKSTYKTGTVQGASTVEAASSMPGFSVNIVANSSSWDLVEYVCKTLDGCSQASDSGMRWATVSGGQTPSHRVDISYTPELNDYSYIKIQVKSGWGKSLKAFKITELGNVPDSKEVKDTLIIPLAKVKTQFITSGTFSDN